MTEQTRRFEPYANTRSQGRKAAVILDAALEVFSGHGFRGATLDMIAEAAGISKPNLLYYFPSKEAVHQELLSRLLDTWLDPLLALDPNGDALSELMAYVHRKLDMAQQYPRESRLFANEILHGAPHISPVLSGELRTLVDERALVIARWSDEGRIARVDPHHLIFSIWSTTQHYADFSAQLNCVLGAESDPFPAARRHLDQLFRKLLTPEPPR